MTDINEDGESTCAEQGSNTDNKESTLTSQDDLPSLCSDKMTSSSQHSTRSSFDKASSSITAEPCCNIDCSSSLSQADHTSSHSSPSLPAEVETDMTSLGIFGASFRHWAGSASASPPKQSNVDSKDHMSVSYRKSVDALHDIGSMQYTRLRQPGIRERTDESCDLPKSNDIMQHLSESCRNRNAQHVGTDASRETSYESTADANGAENDLEAAQEAYDTLEAEIDQLKEDVFKMRQNADKGRTTPKTEQELESDKYLSTRSLRKLAGQTPQQHESAAARLQRLHEATAPETGCRGSELPTPQLPPSPMDFPALGVAKSSPMVESPPGSFEADRRPSYAHTAAAGMMEAINKAYAPSTARCANSKISESTSDEPLSAADLALASSRAGTETMSTIATEDSSDGHDDEEGTVIVMSEHVNTSPHSGEHAVNSKAATPAFTSKAGKQAPHFAQPTKSFARRAGETLRKEAASMLLKPSGGSLSPRSIKSKEPTLATAKRAAQQQKRKSLPGDWLNTADQQNEGAPVDTAVKASNVAGKTNPVKSSGTTISTSIAGDWQLMDSPFSKENLAAKAKATPPWSPQRKKASSYMSPTSATKQRNVTALVREKTKKETPSPKPALARADSVLTSEVTVSSPRRDTTLSDTSSVHFILDRPSFKIPAAQDQASSIGQKNAKSVFGSPSPAKKTGSVASPESIASRQVSPSKIPKSQPIVERQIRHDVSRSESRSSDTFSSMPDVANTTLVTKRRTSNADILKPIIDRLEAKGLLKDEPAEATNVTGAQTAKADFGTALHAAREKLPSSPTRRSEMRSDISIKSLDNPMKGMPPHLRRSREASAVSTSTDATLCLGATPTLNAVPELAASRPATVRTTSTPSLRATAQEFKPMKNFVEDVKAFDSIGALGYFQDNDWSRMSSEMRKRITTMREYKRNEYPDPSRHTPYQLAPKVADGRVWIDSANQTPTTATVPITSSPFGPQAGQILKPALSSGKKSVQWMLQGTQGGRETPIKFGRAPAPIATPIFSSYTPSSDDLSPKTPGSLRGWHIGSSQSSSPYGWSGGDGKEIRFNGYGAYAEQNPNQTVTFDFQGQKASFAATMPNGFTSDEDKENTMDPRFRRRWAEKMGYERAPCGSMEITHAVEQMPYGSRDVGYCFDCVR